MKIREGWGGKKVARLGEVSSKEELAVGNGIRVTHSLSWRRVLGQSVPLL